MLWIILSLLTALAVSSQDAWVKKYFSHLSPYEMLAFPFIYSLPLLVVAVWFVPVPRLDITFFWCFLASIPINGVAALLYMKAIKESPLSLTLPYLAFTPAFMILTGFLFLGEVPNFWGVIGIINTCLGSYVLNLGQGRWSVIAPFKAILQETGSWLMMIVAFLFSFGAVVGKKAIMHSSPLFFSISFFVVYCFVMLFILYCLKKIRFRTFKESPVKGMIAGIFFAAHIIFHGYAISLTKAVYMISLKRMSILFGVIYGGLFFRESNIKMRFAGALLMLSGAVLIMLKGV